MDERPEVARAEVDRLRGVVHDCRRHGPGGQNRDGHPDFGAHLAGRVAWVAAHDPARGARLLAELSQVDWSR